MQSIYKNFGHRVKFKRERWEMTQAKLAKKVGLTRTSIVNIEAGRQRIMLHDVKKFAKVFKTYPEAILNGLWC